MERVNPLLVPLHGHEGAMLLGTKLNDFLDPINTGMRYENIKPHPLFQEAPAPKPLTNENIYACVINNKHLRLTWGYNTNTKFSEQGMRGLERTLRNYRYQVLEEIAISDDTDKGFFAFIERFVYPLQNALELITECDLAYEQQNQRLIEQKAQTYIDVTKGINRYLARTSNPAVIDRGLDFLSELNNPQATPESIRYHLEAIPAKATRASPAQTAYLHGELL